jgi:hypothetical protein
MDAVNKLRNGNILCGGVGTGKSRTALAYFITKVCGGRINSKTSDIFLEIDHPVDLVIITTARKRDTYEWDTEAAGFGLNRDRELCLYPEIGVYIDSWNNIKKYEKFENAFFIFDEQRVVGKGQWVKSFLKIVKRNKWILLTATPGDDWSDYIPVFIANRFYRNRSEFLSEHAVYNPFITKFPKIDKYIGTKKLCRYRDQITVYMHYKKKTVPHENYILAEYSKDMYKAIFKNRWNILTDQPIKNISELCALLRRVVNSDDSRIEVVRQLIQERKKVIIFYNFDFELQILKDLGEEMHIETREWNGHEHQELPNGDEWIYLVQYAAGAEGWNCITTDTIIFYSLNYSYKATVQAAGRIDRLNTPFTDLNYYYIYSHSPIDLAIRRCLKEKKNFNESKFINSHGKAPQ